MRGVRTIAVEFVGGPLCGRTLAVDGDACPAELVELHVTSSGLVMRLPGGELLQGGRYVLSDRASSNAPYRPLYDFVPAVRE